MAYALAMSCLPQQTMPHAMLKIFATHTAHQHAANHDTTRHTTDYATRDALSLLPTMPLHQAKSRKQTSLTIQARTP